MIGDMDCDCLPDSAPPEFLLPPPPIPPFLSIDMEQMCAGDGDMCANLMYIDSNLSSRISTIIAIFTGILVVFAILGLLVYAKCRQNKIFENFHKNKNVEQDRCVYTKNNITNMSNYYEDINEMRNVSSLPTYHGPIIKPAEVHHPKARNLHQINCRRPAFVAGQPNYQDNYCGNIYEELDNRSARVDSEDEFAEDESSSVDYKYTKPDNTYHNSETLPLNRYTTPPPRSRVRGPDISNDCWSHVKTFQSQKNSHNDNKSVTSDLECGTSDVSENSSAKTRENHFHCDHRVNQMADVEFSRNRPHGPSRSGRVGVHRVNSERRDTRTSKSLRSYENRSEIGTSNCDPGNDVTVGWKRGILLPDPAVQRLYQRTSIFNVPYAVHNTNRHRSPIIIKSNLSHNTNRHYFDRSTSEAAQIQDSSFGSDSGYSNHTQSSFLQNLNR